MGVSLQIVDRIGTAATEQVLLDLNDGATFNVRQGLSFPTPDKRRVGVASMLRDGEDIVAAAYENRRIPLPLDLRAATRDALGAEVQKLNRLLERPRFLLRYTGDGASKPLFFRCYSSPAYRIDEDYKPPAAIIDAEIIAEPFALGRRMNAIAGTENTDSSVTINNDIAHATNPCFYDVAAANVVGEVATPAWIAAEDLSDALLYVAVRRHGTPSQNTYFAQIEALNGGVGLDADTTIQNNDAAMSGAGQNYMKTTFATVTAMADRVGGSMRSGVVKPDWRGVYRVLVRLRKSVAGDTIKVRLTYGAAGAAPVALPAVTLPAVAGPFWVDLGLLPAPFGGSPSFGGYTGLNTDSGDTAFALQAQRVAGTGHLHWDCVAHLPADEEMFFADTNGVSASTPFTAVWDGPQESSYVLGAGVATPADGPQSAKPVPLEGGFIMLTPNNVNRLLVLRPRTLNSDVLTDTTKLHIQYWPRYLTVPRAV